MHQPFCILCHAQRNIYIIYTFAPNQPSSLTRTGKHYGHLSACLEENMHKGTVCEVSRSSPNSTYPIVTYVVAACSHFITFVYKCYSLKFSYSLIAVFNPVDITCTSFQSICSCTLSPALTSTGPQQCFTPGGSFSFNLANVNDSWLQRLLYRNPHSQWAAQKRKGV